MLDPKNMEIHLINDGNKDCWNSLVEEAPAFCIMQTYEWGELRETQGWKVYRLALMENNKMVAGAQVLFRPFLKGLLSVGYLPRGPIIQVEDQDIVKALLSAIHALAHKSRSIFLKIEPYWVQNPTTARFLEEQGFIGSNQTNQPRASILLDLTQTPEDLLAKMHRTSRYNIRVAVRNGVSIYEGQENDLPSFYDMLTQTAERNNFPVRPFDYYRQEWLKYHHKGCARLFIAKYQGKPIGGRMAFFVGKFAADLHAASLMEFNHLKANALLVWEAMLWAKENGCIVYDLWGIPDEVGDAYCKGESEPAQGEGGLWGVYQFKNGFGGRVAYYIGAYDYRYIKPLYSFFVAGIFRNASVEEVLHRFFNR